jgi:hypothetical protein
MIATSQSDNIRAIQLGRRVLNYVSEIENSEVKKKIQGNLIYNEKEVKNVIQLLDSMLDFLAEMPVDKYHNYRDFRNLRLRQYLIHSFIREKYARKVRR